MKGRIICAALLMFSIAPLAQAQNHGFGLGVILGEPTGISAKGWTTLNNAIDVGAAWSFRRKGSFHLHADYLWHFPNLIQSSERFVLFTGLGGRLAVGRGDGVFGVRVVGGFAWWPRNAPIDLFVEFAPIVDLAPATELTANGGLGIRYFF
jgi:hypothetical protein